MSRIRLSVPSLSRDDFLHPDVSSCLRRSRVSVSKDHSVYILSSIYGERLSPSSPTSNAPSQSRHDNSSVFSLLAVFLPEVATLLRVFHTPSDASIQKGQSELWDPLCISGLYEKLKTLSSITSPEYLVFTDSVVSRCLRLLLFSSLSSIITVIVDSWRLSVRSRIFHLVERNPNSNVDEGLCRI
ncbi:hypothetical protein M413DRAFT_323908 [Hebeloma cylindrosporum]|uniref:Uncharacterized protein n=1 Tax=Hebeloma cylindrosporum TaxID=76867 RepID=A0A0C3BX07_HEBCY|nr:hypothetical protein M413DRAFT_323908 [Hebeloma cylindrosporum h7]